MSIAGVVKRRARDCVEVIERTGVYDRGRYSRTDAEPKQLFGNIQPAPRSTIERLPEGTRRDGAVVFFTLGTLNLASSPDGVSDLVRFDGTEYEVAAEEKWRNHRRYTLTRHGQ